MKIGVMGAGSIGWYVGGRLVARGADVILLGRARIKAELETSDLRLTGMSGAGDDVIPKEKVRTLTDVSALSDRDVVLVCVKSAQSAETGRALGPVLGKGTVVVSLQNGLHNAEVLRKELPEHSVLGGIVGFNVVSRGNGVFHQATTGPLAIEMPKEAAAARKMRELAMKLEESGFDVELPNDIRPKQWSKLIMNLNNAVSALSGAPTPELLFNPGYRRVVRAIIKEAIGVLDASSIHPAKLGAIPVGLFPFVLSLPTWLLRVVARPQLAIDPEARSSMWEDLTRGRATEVDYLNGEIVALATKHGVSAPMNERIVEMVHAAERAAKGPPGLSPEAFWSALTRPA